MIRDHVEALRSALGEAERYLRETPDAQIDPWVVVRFIWQAILILAESTKHKP